MTRQRHSVPETGIPWSAIEADLKQMASEDFAWRDGRLPAYTFRATEDAHDVAKQAYALYFNENSLGARRAFPSLKRMEQDIVDMGLELLHAPENAAGSMSTGGTESIFLAVKACRDWFRETNGIARGGRTLNIVAPASLHPAFDKAAHVMDLEVRRTPLGPDYRADVAAMERAIDENTMLIVGSAPCFPHGVVDPIPALGELAEKSGKWLHVDACVGGYFLPFAASLGRWRGAFDFAVPGVRSISADLHKFGYCAKPASTVFYRDEASFAYQRFEHGEWTYGTMVTDTYVGTRPGGAVASAWAVMHYLGRAGYESVATRVLDMVDHYLEGIGAIGDLEPVCQPDLSILSFHSPSVPAAALAEGLEARGWLVNTCREPPSIHSMMSLLHEPVREQYLRDLSAAFDQAKVSGASSNTTERAYS